MEVSEFAGKRFAVVLTDEDDETSVYFGWLAFETDDGVVLRREGGSMPLDEGQVSRIRRVQTDAEKRILPDCDFYVALNVGAGGAGAPETT